MRTSATGKWLLCRVPALAAALLVVPVSGIAQEQLTRMGVVDLDFVARSRFLESEALRAYEARRAEVIAERDAIEEEIVNLEQALVEARQDQNRPLVLHLEQRIFDMRQHLSQFVRVMNDQLQREYDDLKTSDRFIGALNDALEYVAETQGFALIIRRNADLLYWDPDIDLTDEVIAELDRQAARR